MSYVAGRVAIVPKGAFSESTQYDRLDMVAYESNAYVAKTKPPVGTLPTNTQYWALSVDMASKADADDVNSIDSRLGVAELRIRELQELIPLPPISTTPSEYQKLNKYRDCPISIVNSSHNCRSIITNTQMGLIFVAGSDGQYATTSRGEDWSVYSLPMSDDDSFSAFVNASNRTYLLTRNGELYSCTGSSVAHYWTHIAPYNEGAKILSLCYNPSDRYYYVQEMTQENGHYNIHIMKASQVNTRYSLTATEVAYLGYESPFEMTACSLFVNGLYVFSINDIQNNQRIIIMDDEFNSLDSFYPTHTVDWLQEIPNNTGNSFISIQNQGISIYTYNEDSHETSERIVISDESAIRLSKVEFCRDYAYFCMNGNIYHTDLAMTETPTIAFPKTMVSNGFSIIGRVASSNRLFTISYQGQSYMLVTNGCDYVLRVYDDSFLGAYEWVKVVN